MNLESKKTLIVKDRQMGLSYGKLALKYGLKRSSIQYIILNYGKQHKKRGPKEKINKSLRRNMKALLNESRIANAKCSSVDIIQELSLTVSKRTVCRTLKCLQFDYKKLPHKFMLTAGMRQKRVELARQFLQTGICWNSVIFSDEKFFTLHGTDSYYSWLQKNRSPRRIKQIVRSPGLMVWALILPNCLLSYEIMIGKQNSAKYIELIKSKAIPIIKLNLKESFLYQQDNAPIHVSKETLNFFKESKVKLLDWPSYSPDLNIVENIWSMLSSDIYGQGSIKNIRELRSRINDSVTLFNETRATEVLNLYNSMPSRLCSILENHGQRLKY